MNKSLTAHAGWILGAISWLLALCGCPEQPALSDSSHLLDAGTVDSSHDSSEFDAGRDGTGPDGFSDAAQVDAPLGEGCELWLSLSGTPLRSALFAEVDGHRSLSYDGAREAMYGVTGNVDVVDGQIESVYTGMTVEPDGSRAPQGTFNTEHSWPRSEGADRSPAVSDMHHLFPCDEASNNQRGTVPFGLTDCDLSDTCVFASGGSELGLDRVGNEVFEVRLRRRGDIARALFYFSIRYGLPIDEAEERVLRFWHSEDAPDEAEVSRTDRIEALQNNRNPFVDCPEVVPAVDDF